MLPLAAPYAGMAVAYPGIIDTGIVSSDTTLLPFWKVSVVGEVVLLLRSIPRLCRRLFFDRLRSFVENLDAIEDFSGLHRSGTTTLHWVERKLLDAADHRGVPRPTVGYH
ncbi:hypothetical protein POL68_39695 [Stigmatella sp. ncwal1]|uniref:Uncharacterized protein n=1 Tax=Stigmatella ashevillensis TaxID=2995309 RepID=A0ABT5DLV3_9BACT|nr:hypothetical protein [Stigmatella ashevillena]MDC0714640.1 hypothetical protein [Stigmatella ashevillena]